jgi:hypothetical protein
MILEVYKTDISKGIVYGFCNALFLFSRTVCSFGEVNDWYVRHLAVAKSVFCWVGEERKESVMVPMRSFIVGTNERSVVVMSLVRVSVVLTHIWYDRHAANEWSYNHRLTSIVCRSSERRTKCSSDTCGSILILHTSPNWKYRTFNLQDRGHQTRLQSIKTIFPPSPPCC